MTIKLFSGNFPLTITNFQAGMFAIRARRKVATERDFLDAVEKVVRQGTKFSSTYVFDSVSTDYFTKLIYIDRPLYN